ncbi:class I SAM-dependent methyltransferase [Aromatoleum anaerobium]|uniref:Methyltransferase domain-containing protein n=1 Tax=Aromatoleum anaerobium TaxID=182180 RepID=A0ABX1PHD9_9RHOO|nr:class I SAM-dependent methyltransferase [Aromatoleum anaerobium]MCK0507684.1 class I SAM-dependent methyltransferase [Aromatoleum anaerobium]
MNAPTALCPSSQSIAVPPPPDLEAIKLRQQATWASGDYGFIGTRLQIVGELLAEAVDLRAGERVIDVAAGNGNATLAAARRFAEVTAIDYVPHLLDQAAGRARADGLAVDFRVADAEALPFADGSFDVALSTFGVMFTPDHDRSAGELLRVVRPGGRIGLAAWTPAGFIGELFRVIGAHVPPPAGVRSPLRWGDEPYLVELFGRHATDIRCARRSFNFRYRSAAHWIEVFRTYYGPTHKAFEALDDAGQARLHADLLQLLESRNTAGPDSLVVPSEYLEVVITRQ